ncbi:SCO family protein [Halobacillus sp. Marseille-Q1614]|uniref:SCO family protein n=1 Tax=Halobacillus sp. Marseille-Q1614 TaxID=2709134 RepID=UPI00156F12D2|nr:SCO family protein [Halobacillus sp. Marseille-Q1614]
MKLYAAIILLSLALLSGCGSPIEENMSREVDPFTATNQSREVVNLPDDLEGKYWVANHIFTQCDTVCPPMTNNMARLQQLAKEEDVEVHLVSFSVDPEYDTENRLTEFAKQFNADFDNWDFLTGYAFKDVKELSIKSFQSPLKKLEGTNQVAHGTAFYLVTPKGKVIKSYDGTKAAEMTSIVEDLKKLQ